LATIATLFFVPVIFSYVRRAGYPKTLSDDSTNAAEEKEEKDTHDSG
jgi:hypothetical protein